MATKRKSTKSSSRARTKRSASPSAQARGSASKAAPRSRKAAEAQRKPARGPTVRAPAGAEELKARLGRLATARGRIKTLKRSMNRSFHEIGSLLAEIQEERLHEAKGYGSFEAFLEREVDLGVQLGMRLLRIARTFQREAAEEAGLERAAAALEVLDGAGAKGTGTGGAPAGGGTPLPPHKR